MPKLCTTKGNAEIFSTQIIQFTSPDLRNFMRYGLVYSTVWLMKMICKQKNKYILLPKWGYQSMKYNSAKVGTLRPAAQMRLESLPKTKRLVQSVITSTLVRQLTSLLILTQTKTI